MDCLGWRVALCLVCVCISFLSVSCVLAQPNPPLPPTELPSITLTLWLAATSTPLLPTLSVFTATPQLQGEIVTPAPIVYEVQPDQTMPEIAAAFGINLETLQAMNPSLLIATPAAGAHVMLPPMLPTSIPQPMALASPSCYLTTDEKLVCLGYIQNDQPNAVSRVSVRVDLVDDVGAVLASQVATIEQRVIPAGDSAPYRVVFDGATLGGNAISTLPLDHSTINHARGMVVSLQSADRAAGLSPVTIGDQDARFENGYYHLRANIYSESPAQAAASRAATLRVVVTVYDAPSTSARRRVVGYRVLDFDAPSAQAPVNLSLMIKPLTPIVQAAQMSHTLYAELWDDE